MTGPLVLIEPYAHRLGGHHQHALVALARASTDAVVVVPYGIGSEAATALRTAGAHVMGPVGPAARVLFVAANTAEALSTVGLRIFADRRWPTSLRRAPHQITLLARYLIEAACLRTARRLAPGPGAVVVLSASEALHGAAALLGGLPHLRFVHEYVTSEDAAVRLLGRLNRAGEKRVLALYPTAAVRDQLAPAFPRLTGEVRTFAVDDGRRLSEAEREGARAAFDIPAGRRAVCLVGGWWPHKDIGVIDASLSRLKEPLHLVVTGHPLDEATLARWRALPRVRLHTVPGPVSEEVLRIVYGAADAALVARHRGVGKESGLVMGTVRHGVPLIVSDHDPGLTARLTGQDWARVFPAEDPDGLAEALDRLTADPPNPPGTGAADTVGLPTADRQAAFLTDAYARLLAKEC
ncbi:glycosyltransferase [Streptomyces sp. BB1-1-1]|uniref:glycosyltransferase n=1 Tax=Streptomyces sp. BB1-1-1 TaxID=3074430 RepID=UPI0028774661|nr:glycosyltransferase [Streptomyces sp. BB1-1-1]WND36387.1 glycosyltransferase [Streptomyces sp. BB1-1-1]